MVFESDIVYVGGGNADRMLQTWRRYEVDEILREASQRDIVLSGLSAGSICWFRYALSSATRARNASGPLTRIKGLDLVNALNSPHYDVDEQERANVREVMETTPGVAITLDNCCAIEFVDDTYRVINSKFGAGAYRVYWQEGEFHEEAISRESGFSPINRLLKKPPADTDHKEA